MALDPERFADIVAQAIEIRLAPIVARLAAMEARPPIPGPPGIQGRDGLNGKDGADGQSGRDGAPGLNGKDGADAVVAPIAGLDPALISASADMLLRKELAALDAAAPPRMAKRIIRDARGKIERVIDEPVRG